MIMKKILFMSLLLLISSGIYASDYVLPIIECDGSANVRAKATTKSDILMNLDYHSKPHKILAKQGKWYRIELANKQSGFVHHSQIQIVHKYVVNSADGSANVRDIFFPEHLPINKKEIVSTLSNGTVVQIIPQHNKGDWLFYTNQGSYREKDEYGNEKSETGYIHKSLLRKLD